MALEMKPSCEKCEVELNGNAFICVHECTFCEDCTQEMSGRCPNCSGELVRRPERTGSCPLGSKSVIV